MSPTWGCAAQLKVFPGEVMVRTVTKIALVACAAGSAQHVQTSITIMGLGRITRR